MKAKNLVMTITIPIIIILTNFSLLAFNEKYYEKQYEKNNVYQKIQKEQADEATGQLVDYLKYGKEIKGDFFNEKEKTHLKDVRRIIKYLILTLALSTALFVLTLIYSIKNRRMLGITLIAGGILTTALIILLFLLLTNFQQSFLRFHQVMFSNNLWILDPAKDRLIMMLPENFFYDITKNIATRSLITSLIVAAVGSLLVFTRKRD